MQHEKQNRVALVGARRVYDRRETNAECLSFQAAYVAARYRLAPCMARLLCQLSNIGGRLA
ncbi:hypothetical protein GOD47_01420 [Sinorhizobium medicae]|nr:hypothetical protein [Sinorhizobium medicae]MDX0662669.1 hypothetical protein [Sinorhizobium medicae]MDX0723725.1 hypothetical protein [Sinorhizobium medicae]MDX0729795.1 hypothetical protein [Sinorhizobium medicae]MDX0809884.1 hypothetical protein [Sinorhizobium medicae]